jgi:ankyrin repeat protein
MESQLFELFKKNDLTGLREALSANPNLANEGVGLDESPQVKGHPLHRICDVVFKGKITDDQAIGIAKILLEFGANIDGYMDKGDNNTPLIAAASLYAEMLGIFYVSRGANIYYAPKSDGGTALHWASFCGKDKLVAELIKKGANINQRDTRYNSVPLGWAAHAMHTENKNNLYNQLDCVKLLLRAGADKGLLDKETIGYLQNTAQHDAELKALI